VSTGVRVWCVRHGESEANHQVPGAAEDCGLTELGRGQVIAAARLLAAEPITRIYSSTALRARQTAEILATAPDRPGLRISAMPELVEVDASGDVLRAWVFEQDLGRPAADGETGHQVVARVTAAFQQIADAHPGETVAVVGHVTSLTVALARFCALGATVWGAPLPNARPFLVEWDGRTWRCPAWPGEQMVEERDLDLRPFCCCGGADLHPFRCPACARIMVFCYACDTLYDDLHRLDQHDTPVDHAEPGTPLFACPACGHACEYFSRKNDRYVVPLDAWLAAGLGHLLRKG
jgi:broad specificity phosphatase PhoE